MPRASGPCHTPLSRNLTAVFPVEIFDYIIDSLGEEVADNSANSELPWSPRSKALRALKSCSVVCSSFRRRVLPYLFQSISVQFYKGDIFRLATVLQNNPTLALYVHNLSVFISDMEQVPKEVAETLLHFTSLTSLAICDVASFQGPDVDFCRNLMNTYLESDKLTSLELTRESHVPFDVVLSCRRLETLRLYDFDVGGVVLSGPPSTIKHLHVCEGISSSDFPLSFLSHFPSLVTLEIDEDFNAERPSLTFSSEAWDVGIPSFNLEKLHLNAGCNDGINTVIGFYLEHARQQGVKAFRSLKELDVVVAEDIDLAAIKSLLEDKPALRSLKINAAAHTASCSSVEGFVLHEHLLSSMGTLTKMTLSFPAIYYDNNEYERLMDIIETLLSSMPEDNVLESLDLNCQLNFSETFKCPPASSWDLVARLLATQSAFPNLKTVALDINFVIDIIEPYQDDGVQAKVDAFERNGLKIFNRQLGHVLQPLVARHDVKLNWFTWACTSWEHVPAIVKEVM